MKERKNKNNTFKIVVGIIITIIILIVFIVGSKKLITWNVTNNNSFFRFDIIEYFDLVLSFFSLVIGGVLLSFFLYFLTKRDAKIEKKKEFVEKLVTKVQEYIKDAEIMEINKEIINGNNLTLNLKLRKINNHISYLKDLAKGLGYEKLINNISEKFHEYKTEIFRMKEDNDFGKKSFNNLTRIIYLVDDGLEEILVEMYK